MRFALCISIFCALVACGEEVPKWQLERVAEYEREYESTDDLWEKKHTAELLAKYHWDPREAVNWDTVAVSQADKWRQSNCTAGQASKREQDLLEKVTGYSMPPTNIEWSGLAETYGDLYELCFDQAYADKYAEFKALAEFDGRTSAICEEVIRTYSGFALADKILSEYSQLASMTRTVAQELGDKAVVGYGECQCAMHHHFKVRDNMSIGFCIEDKYYDCETAYCGATGDRVEIAKKGYRYEIPRNSFRYGSDISPGSSASELMEWGRIQTQNLMDNYCNQPGNC